MRSVGAGPHCRESHSTPVWANVLFKNDAIAVCGRILERVTQWPLVGDDLFDVLLRQEAIENIAHTRVMLAGRVSVYARENRLDMGARSGS